MEIVDVNGNVLDENIGNIISEFSRSDLELGATHLKEIFLLSETDKTYSIYIDNVNYFEETISLNGIDNLKGCETIIANTTDSIAIRDSVKFTNGDIIRFGDYIKTITSMNLSNGVRTLYFEEDTTITDLIGMKISTQITLDCLANIPKPFYINVKIPPFANTTKEIYSLVLSFK